MKAKDLDKQFQLLSKVRLGFIKTETNKSKRFWMLVWHYISFPFIWIWHNLKDIRTLVIFVIVCLVVSCEVWIPYLIGFITQNAWWFGVGSACWAFWLLPGTPFLPLCIFITLLIKGIFFH